MSLCSPLALQLPWWYFIHGCLPAPPTGAWQQPSLGPSLFPTGALGDHLALICKAKEKRGNYLMLQLPHLQFCYMYFCCYWYQLLYCIQASGRHDRNESTAQQWFWAPCTVLAWVKGQSSWASQDWLPDKKKEKDVSWNEHRAHNFAHLCICSDDHRQISYFKPSHPPGITLY